MDYSITVDTSTVPYPTFNYFTTTDWTSSQWTYPKTVYKYQLICPRCGTSNWGELDQIVTCSGYIQQTGPLRNGKRKLVKKPCEASLKAVSQEVDFEVSVG